MMAPWNSRRSLLRASAAGLAAFIGSSQYGHGNYQSKAAGSAFSPLLTHSQGSSEGGEPARAEITVGAVANSIGQRFCGLSYEKAKMWSPLFDRHNLRAVGMFKRLGASNLRIGGNSADRTEWKPDSRPRTPGQISRSDIDALAEFTKETGWDVLYGLNLATSNPQLAAAEAMYVSRELGQSLAGFEIGNEPNDYEVKGLASKWDVNAYIQRWLQFAEAILDRVPTAKLTGPALSGHNIREWSEPFAAATSNKLSILTHHYYCGSGHESADPLDMLLNRNIRIEGLLDELGVVARRFGLPFRLAETNSFYGGGVRGVSNSFASALWALDFLFLVAQHGGTGVNFEAGGYGGGYTPILDDNGLILEAKPEFYGLLFFTLAGIGRLRRTVIDAAGLNATAYAIEHSDSSLSVVVINKDHVQDLRVFIDSGKKLSTGSLLRLSAPSLTATSGVTIESSVVGKNGSFLLPPPREIDASQPISAIVNARSAALFQLR